MYFQSCGVNVDVRFLEIVCTGISEIIVKEYCDVSFVIFGITVVTDY